MKSIIVRSELKQLARNRWLLILSLLLFFLFIYAGWNGKMNVNQRKEAISGALAEMKTQDALLLARLDSLQRGLALDMPTWQYPSQPTAMGNNNPRVAAFHPDELALIATGQSDVFTHYAKPTLHDNTIELSFTELTSPVKLLFGNFDISFVTIYLLPLIVIAFCYNIFSAEKEAGSLRMVAASPVDLRYWLLQKTVIRYCVVAILALGALLTSLVINGAGFDVRILQLLLTVLFYLSFWFALSFLINLAGLSSEKNAVSLLTLWILFVLIIPAGVSQMANDFYPIPSRTLLINKMRTVQAEADHEQDKILDDFLRDHPEMIVTRAASENTAYGWWQRYFASKDLVEKKLEPVMNTFEEKMNRQQSVVRTSRFISPAIIVQDAFNELSHTSTDHYAAYRKSVVDYTYAWRNFFLPLIYAEKEFEASMVNQLPAFEIDDSNIKSRMHWNLIALLVITTGIMSYALMSYRRNVAEKVLIQ